MRPKETDLLEKIEKDDERFEWVGVNTKRSAISHPVSPTSRGESARPDVRRGDLRLTTLAPQKIYRSNDHCDQNKSAREETED